MIRSMVPAIKRRRKAVKIEFEDGPLDNVKEIASEVTEIAVEDSCAGNEPLWKKHLENIKQMRSSGDAPVDSMGCHMLADKLADPKVFLY